jgi:hypothetical protein
MRPLKCLALHYITLHYITLHCTALTSQTTGHYSRVFSSCDREMFNLEYVLIIDTQGNFISLTVIRPTTGEGGVQDIGNLAIRRSEGTNQPTNKQTNQPHGYNSTDTQCLSYCNYDDGSFTSHNRSEIRMKLKKKKKDQNTMI